MAWFKIDDSSHMHPKFIDAGNAALGLWLRCGAYCAQHLTEGTVPASVAKQYGTATQAAKLVKVGLWHEAGHECPRCPQPPAGSYVVHDFFEGGRNATRAQVEANRKDAADRKARSRAQTNRARSGDDSAADRAGIAGDPHANRTRNMNGSKPDGPPNGYQFPSSSAGQAAESQRDKGESVTGPLASTKPVQSATSYGSSQLASPDGPRIAEPVRPLVEAMTEAGLVVSWELNSSEWALLQALMDRCTVPVLVDHARAAWQGARNRPRSARYFLAGWRALPAVPEPTAPGTGAAVVPLHRRHQQPGGDWLDRAMARAQARMGPKEENVP